MRPSWSQERPERVAMATLVPDCSYTIHADLSLCGIGPLAAPVRPPCGLQILQEMHRASYRCILSPSPGLWGFSLIATVLKTPLQPERGRQD
ncbi:hypothetical protein MHYP_G00078050 [Metynnis hypsauchen]